MTPTQAQIEAQLEGLATGLEQRGEKSAAHTIRRYLALTAAAQVGEQPFGPWWEEAKRTFERDTIERCAQVAEEYIEATRKLQHPHIRALTAGNIAAAIRKLKDVP